MFKIKIALSKIALSKSEGLDILCCFLDILVFRGKDAESNDRHRRNTCPDWDYVKYKNRENRREGGGRGEKEGGGRKEGRKERNTRKRKRRGNVMCIALSLCIVTYKFAHIYIETRVSSSYSSLIHTYK